MRIHNSCICNEEIALRNRHLVDRSYIPFHNARWNAALSYSLDKLMSLDCKRTSVWKIANGYTGGKRQQYLRACNMLAVEGFMRKDAILKMFVKADKMSLGNISEKPPRAIQYRSPKYNLLLAHYLKDFEHQFYEVSTGKSSTPDLAKGKNLVDRARHLLQKSGSISNPVYINTDFKHMDSCVRIEHQKSIFQRCYLKKFRSKMLKKLLYHQLKNKGYSKNGIKYKVPGTRCSGDFTTGFENSLITWVILRYALHLLVTDSEIYVDGDDADIIISKNELKKFQDGFENLVLEMGFEVKISVTEDIELMDFCQGRILLGEIPRMSRNPERALSNFNVSLKHYPRKVWPRLIQAKADCERYGNPGVPILQELGKAFDQKVKPLYDKEQQDYLKLVKDLKYCEVTSASRIAYDMAWDVSPYEQELIEQSIYTNLQDCAVNSVLYYESVYKDYQTLKASSESIN